MIAGVPVESSPHEQRVALVPAVVPTLIKAGLQVLVEPGAGEKAGFPDSASFSTTSDVRRSDPLAAPGSPRTQHASTN